MVDHSGNTPRSRPASMPPIAHCVAFCSAFGLIFTVSGAMVLSSDFSYRRLQLRIVSVCMLVMGAILLTAAIVLTVKWCMWYLSQATRQQLRHCDTERWAAIVIRVPTVSGGTYVYEYGAASTPGTGAVGLPPPPAYEDVVRPPPSYESAILMTQLEKETQNELTDGALRSSAPAEPASTVSPVCHF